MAVGVSYYGKDTILWVNTLAVLLILPKPPKKSKPTHLIYLLIFTQL